MNDSKTPKPPLSRRKAIVFGGILALLVLGTLEIGARIGLRIWRGFDGKHLYQYVFDPYKNLLPTPNYVDARGIQHNSQGFRRSAEVPRGKPPNTYRIFLMGASTAYGIGGLWPHLQRDFAVLQNSETIDAYLETLLADSLPDTRVEVINAAITSTWTHHHLVYLNQSILGYKPDMVLFLDGFNDFFAFNEQRDQFADYSYNMPSRIILGDPTLKALAYGNGWWLFRRSAFAHLLARAGKTIVRLTRRERDPPPLDIEAAVAGIKKVFPANALTMQERIGLILRAEDVRAVFMLQPLLILERDRPGMPDIERQLFEFNVSSYREHYEEFMHRAVEFIREQEVEMAASVGAEFIDLTKMFDGIDSQVYTDYAHLTPLGNRVVAQHIARRILPLIRGDLASQD